VTRHVAGIFDRSSRTNTARLAGALEQDQVTVLDMGPLHAAFTQPAASGEVLCLLNGYVDNTAELAVALGAPASTAPERVLAKAWREWRRDLLPRLRGEFGLLIWDPRYDEGLIARDQLGTRSWFLHTDGSGAVYFASELRFLLSLLARRPEPDPVTVAHWLTMSNRPGTATLFKGVRRLSPGAALVLDCNRTSEVNYWEARYQPPVDCSPRDAADNVRAVLDGAVARRIAADGLTCLLMSGGLDSASVAAAAVAQAPSRVQAYSAVFPDHPDVDESSLIDELTRTLSLPSTTAEVRPGGLLASGLQMISDWGVPLRSWGDFWATPLLRAAFADGAQITLGGDGGDELFGVRAYLLSDRLLAGHPRDVLALARELPGAGDHPPRRALARMLGDVAVTGALSHRAHKRIRSLPGIADTPQWLLPRATRDLLDSSDPWAWKRLDGPRWWAHTAHAVTQGVDEAGIFEHQRLRAASVGMQARHPMFDLELVELVLRHPPRLTFDRHRNRPILRAAMADRLPDSIRLRPQKAWFNSVIIDSLSGDDGDKARRALCDPSAEIRAYVDQAGVEQALFGDRGPVDRRAPRFQRTWQLWRLLMAECWLRAQAGRAGILGEQASPSAIVLHRAR
jgi:asparagine synthase (glutamine-hydrolysing)